MIDEEANEEIPCPGCKGAGKGCEWCDGGGTLARWIVETITTDGIVR